MIRTPNLDLPIYDTPDKDIFDIQEWNNANIKIDSIYKEFNTIREEIEVTNPNAEIIVARKGESTLGDKITKIDTSIAQIVELLNVVPTIGDIDGGTF